MSVRSLAAVAATRLASIIILATFLCSMSFGQDLAHYWNFNNPSGGGNPWPQPVEANHGSGTISYNFPGGVVNFAGTTENAQPGVPAGGSFSIQGGSGTGNNGRYFQLNTSLQGYENLEFSYATRGTSTGFNSQLAEFSTDGGDTWTFIGEETNSTQTSFFTVAYDLSGFPQLNGAPNAIFRVTLSGATSDTGNNRFDNITIEGDFVGGGSGTGTGVASINQDLIEGGTTHTLGFSIAAISNDPEHTLTRVDLVLPNGWGPLTAGDVTVAPAGADVTIVGQMIQVSNLNVTQSNPVSITLNDLWVAGESGSFTFSIRTASGTDEPVVIANQPSVLVWGTPIPISEAGANNSQGVSTLLGEWVTIQGVVTVSDQFQTGTNEIGPSYLQDDTGGFAVFSPSGVSAEVEIGDEVVLFGRVDQFFGLNQLDASTIVMENVSTGNEVEPTLVTLSDIANDGVGGVEVYEGMLIRANNVTVNTTHWNSESPGTNYQLTDATGTLDVRINHAVDFANTPAPSGAFDIIGVVSQFRPSPPYIGGYQLMPRFGEDIIDSGDAPVITSPAPFETAASPNSVTVSWSTDRPAHSEVRYVAYPSGTTGVVIDETPKEEHMLVLSGLNAATVYSIEIRTAAGEDTTRIPNYPVSTTAAPGTTHDIQVYFTGTVEHDLTLYTPALSANPTPRLIELINGAEHSLDITFYSLSGGPGSLIANAIVAAHNRGVQVRMIMENDNTGTAPPTLIQNAGVPFITDAFGSMNNGQALQHNKVVVVDYRGGDPEDIWVMMGSWNPTDQGTNNHNQNILFIQDGSVAAAYTREFEQMWGSSTMTPSSANARFGSNKLLVSPSVLWIGDVRARLFFSPQGFGAFGSTENQIIRTLTTAQHQIDLGLNLITRQTLVNAMHARFQAGVDVRGAIGDINVTGSVFNELAAWADVHDHPAATFGLLHHKYALVDAVHHHVGSPKTITGSHNWSRSANESNDENTLIIHDADITNQFLQEYAMRYWEAGGEDTFPVSVEPIDSGATFSLSGNYPNPFTTNTTFEFTLPTPSQVTIRVYNVLGQEVARVLESSQEAGTHSVTFDASQLSSGVYFYRLEAISGAQRFNDTGRMTIVR